MAHFNHKLSFLTLLLFFLWNTAKADEKTFSTTNGLSTNQTLQIVELPNGQILVETEGVFNLFDGMQFYTQEYNLENTVEMQCFGGCAHWAGPSGLIWMRDYYHLFIYDPDRREFRYDIPKLIAPSGEDIRNVKNFCMDSDTTAWLYMNDGRLLHYDWEHPAKLTYQLTKKQIDNDLHVTTVLKVGKGKYLIFINNGAVVHWDDSKKKAVNTDTQNVSDGNPITDHSVYGFMHKDGKTAIISQNKSNGGLFLYDVPSRQWTQLLQAHVNSMERLRNGQILIATNDGLYFLSEKDINKSSTTPPELIHKQEGQHLTFAHQDRLGGIWTGVNPTGIVYHSPKKHPLKLVTDSENMNVKCMLRMGDNILIGTDRGIYNYNTKEKILSKVQGLGEDYNCIDMSPLADGSIVVGTIQGLLTMHYYKESKTWKGELHNYPEQKHSHYRFCIVLDGGKRLLVCNLNKFLGYVYPDKNIFECLNDKNEQLDRYRAMRGAVKLDGKTVLVYTQNGIFTLNTATDEIAPYDPVLPYLKYSNKFNCAFLDSHKRLWLGTQNGLILNDQTNKTTCRLTAVDGLSNPCIQSIVEDHKGRIWLGTAKGINRITINGTDTIVTQFTTAEGLPETEMVEKAAVVATDGTAYFATKSGIYAIDANIKDTDSHTLPVVLTRFLVGEKSLSLDNGETILNYDENYLTLTFSALNHINYSQTHYRYRMKGLDKHWRGSSEGRGRVVVNYNAMPPGSYVFEVQAAVGDGEWGPVYQKPIEIRPPWWLSWWAKTFYLLLLLAAGYFALNQYLKKKRESMAKDNEEKVNRLFERREEARHQFAESVKIDPHKIGINEEEEQLIEQMVKYIDEHIENPDYNVDMLARDVAMSRSSLYTKMNNMLGITPSDFIRNVRLKYAAELLTESNIPINEVCLKVGFNSQRTFSSNFKKMFGILPSEYRGKPSTD